MFVRGLLNPLNMFVLSRQLKTLQKAFQLAKNGESLRVTSDTKGDTGQLIETVNMPGEIRGGAIGKRQFESEMGLELKSLRDELSRLQKEVEKVKTRPQAQNLEQWDVIIVAYRGIKSQERRRKLRYIVQRQQYRTPVHTTTKGYRSLHHIYRIMCP